MRGTLRHRTWLRCSVRMVCAQPALPKYTAQRSRLWGDPRQKYPMVCSFCWHARPQNSAQPSSTHIPLAFLLYMGTGPASSRARRRWSRQRAEGGRGKHRGFCHAWETGLSVGLWRRADFPSQHQQQLAGLFRCSHLKTLLELQGHTVGNGRGTGSLGTHADPAEWGKCAAASASGEKRRRDATDPRVSFSSN